MENIENIEIGRDRGNLNPEIISEAEIKEFREELEKKKKEAEENSQKVEKGEYFSDAELLDVDFDKLVKPDWFLLKLWKEGKLNYKILSQYRTKEVGPQTMDILESAAKKKQHIDLTKLPREAYMAWISKTYTAEQAKRKLEERMMRKAA